MVRGEDKKEGEQRGMLTRRGNRNYHWGIPESSVGMYKEVRGRASQD